MRNLRLHGCAGFLALGAMAACGSDQVCDVAEQTGCDDGLVCEAVVDAEPACFAPVVVRGGVFDLADAAVIEGARLVALDINGAPVSAIAVSDAAGAYELRIPSPRDAEGTPIAAEVTLRADAAAYQSFPGGLRQALPIDTGDAVAEETAWVVSSAQTDVGLIALETGAGTGILRGVVEVPEDRRGVLVVAEDAGGVGATAIADTTGDYAIFNLAAGDYTLTAYAMGSTYEQAIVTVASGAETAVDLARTGAATGSVDGQISIVNAPGGATTSVILAVESTFDELFGRGATVPGMRAPAPGIVADISSAYTIEEVPAGRYVVLAAFENDLLVRDPDLSIAGTATLHIEVTSGEVTTVDAFKVTEALGVLQPGASGPEPMTETPVFMWEDDSSEDLYEIVVLDSFGEVVWETTMAGVSGGTPTIEYAGPTLVSGMYYQFRVTSFKNGSPLSRTEDLRGVFFVP